MKKFTLVSSLSMIFLAACGTEAQSASDSLSAGSLDSINSITQQSESYSAPLISNSTVDSLNSTGESIVQSIINSTDDSTVHSIVPCSSVFATQCTSINSPSISIADSTSGNDSMPDEAPLFPNSSYYYNYSTFNRVVNYTDGIENFGNIGYDWSFSSYQNQGTQFYIGSNGKNGNDALFGLTEENGFNDLLTPSLYDEEDITYGMKMEFDIMNITTFNLAWNNYSSKIDVTVLYSLDSGLTWIKGISQDYHREIPQGSYQPLPESITFTQSFAGRVRFAVVTKALTTTVDGGCTMLLSSVSIS